MLNKIINMLGLALFAFVVSYLVSSVFDNIGLQANTIINSILIIAITLLIVTVTIVVITLIMNYVTARQTANHK